MDNAGITAGSLGTRRWHRYPFSAPVRFKIKKAGAASLMNTRGAQVNEGGLAVYSETKLVIGDEAEIEFTNYCFTLRGIVRNHAGGNLYGVEFLAASEIEGEYLALFRQVLRTKGDA